MRAKCPDGAKPEDCRERPGTWSTVRGDALYDRHFALVEIEVDPAAKVQVDEREKIR